MSMKKILALFNEKVIQLKLQGQNDEANKFASYLLAIIIYLRQCIVCPLLPISNIVLDISDYKNKSDLSKSLFNEIKKCDLDAYFANPDSIYSSRIKKVIQVVNKRQSENIIIFTCFRTCLDAINHFLPKDRNVFCITSKDTLQQRNKIIEDFKVPSANGKGNIFLLTYQLGAEGLNLQSANTVLLVDFFWNNGKTQQAIGRVYRQNQIAKEVNIYYFTSNTAMEKVIFEKQNQKLIVLQELHNGQIKSKIDKIKTSEIIKIITSEENNRLIKKIN
jgi:SNF2 family DNA or RNA helicase